MYSWRVPVSGEGNRKCELIHNVLAVGLLNLPENPRYTREMVKFCKKEFKAYCWAYKIQFPEDLKLGWIKKFAYLPDLPKDYTTKGQWQKTLNFMKQWTYNGQNMFIMLRWTIFLNASIIVLVPQTRVSKSPYVLRLIKIAAILNGEYNMYLAMAKVVNMFLVNPTLFCNVLYRILHIIQQAWQQTLKKKWKSTSTRKTGLCIIWKTTPWKWSALHKAFLFIVKSKSCQ